MPWPHLPKSRGPQVSSLSGSSRVKPNRNSVRKKEPQDSNEPCGLEIMWEGPQCPDCHILLFHNHALNHTLLSRASVIHSHPLPGAYRGRHDLASTIDDASGGSEREAHWTFAASHYDGFAGLIGRNRARRIRR